MTGEELELWMQRQASAAQGSRWKTCAVKLLGFALVMAGVLAVLALSWMVG